jgi:hypothetical protein
MMEHVAHRLVDAARQGDIRAVRLALRRMPRQTGGSAFQKEALRQAVKHDQLGVTLELLNHGVNANMTDAYGWSPLIEFAAKGNSLGAQALLQHGADVQTRSPDGWTSLHWAAANGHQEVVDVLCKHGAHVGAVDAAGLTPAAVARRSGHFDVAAVLRDTPKPTPVPMPSPGRRRPRKDAAPSPMFA